MSIFRRQLMMASVPTPIPPTPPLPYDAEVEYLQSTGLEYIDTGISYDSTVTMEASIRKNSDTGNYMFGILYKNSGGTSYRWALNGGNSTSNAAPQFGTITSVRVNFSSNTFHTVKADYRYLTVDGTKTDTNAATFTTDGIDVNITLFGRNTYIYGEGLSMAGQRVCAFGYFKLWKGGELVRDFIPVRVGQTGYMYDKVSGQLFGNASTGGFEIGNDISE